MTKTNPPPGEQDTIVALSTGQLPSGVAVVRVSGTQCSSICVRFAGRLPEPRRVLYTVIRDPLDGAPIDKGLVIWFPGHGSVTGEDCLEFHIHGGAAVVSALLERLCREPAVREAEPGEFARRSFLNGKMDLTEVEGLADLIAAQTEAQRIQAHRQATGALREVYENWRRTLIRIRAMVEAELDFSDEEDVPREIGDKGFEMLAGLVQEIAQHLNDSRAGEIIRDGFRVAILGKPNAGKSTLLNALAKREVAIVTDVPGTTRDVLQVHLNINGYEVLVSDTAGIRKSEDVVEQKGIERTMATAEDADLVLWLREMEDSDLSGIPADVQAVEVVTKDDEGRSVAPLAISAKHGIGLEALIKHIAEEIGNRLGNGGEALLTRTRHRKALEECHVALVSVLESNDGIREIQAEKLRNASECLGRITGRIDVEDLLDVIFAEFCVGK